MRRAVGVRHKILQARGSQHPMLRLVAVVEAVLATIRNQRLGNRAL